ncbi:M48 family metalloprotease [Pilimelia columellifera]|uniref:Peptidase M48 domain-containing protein n=1 Tax=Pilimelia columellifera subsp. columellifera TaxID=706583 RepID=A0ABP6B5Z3_9ACTN
MTIEAVRDPHAPGAPATTLPAWRQSPARGGYLTLIAALLVAGLFAGNTLFLNLFSVRMGQTYNGCLTALGSPPTVLEQLSAWQVRWEACVRPVTTLQQMMSLGCAVSALLLGAASSVALASWQVRRARPVRAPESIQARVRGLALQWGLRRPPRVVVGMCRVRDPYSAGGPGRPTIVLPPGLLGRPDSEVDAVIRHELAHVAAGDATLAWFVRGIWIALLPVLLLRFLGQGPAWSGWR